MAFSYNDNAVPYGSRTETISRGGTGGASSVGTFVFESISISTPSKIGERTDEIGQPNGWWAVSGFRHGSAVLQIPTGDTLYPQVGDWFQDDFGNGTVETWVIVETTQPYAMHDYYKCNVTIRQALNPQV